MLLPLVASSFDNGTDISFSVTIFQQNFASKDKLMVSISISTVQSHNYDSDYTGILLLLTHD